ncbi:hypothetical protein HKX48_004556 [Thoreauomyces humboldtii]|nr:hypothetical protein HKX48_004556 [Thoreauomyces humboldtii]
MLQPPARLGGRRLNESPSPPRPARRAPTAAPRLLSDEDLARQLQEEEYAVIQPRHATELLAASLATLESGRTNRHHHHRRHNHRHHFGDVGGSHLYMRDLERQGLLRLDDDGMPLNWGPIFQNDGHAAHPEHFMEDGDFSYESLLALGERIGDAKPKGLSRTVISSLPSRRYKPGCIPEDEEARCTVCLADYDQGDKIKGTPCAHWFHSGCLDTWLKHSDSCPICRTKI